MLEFCVAAWLRKKLWIWNFTIKKIEANVKSMHKTLLLCVKRHIIDEYVSLTKQAVPVHTMIKKGGLNYSIDTG